ncbi:MAG: hypothetical protein JWO80_5571 [Bryobacterales bacterium]|nr:hypothetical protein [Bryobacterales bacterium]
MIGTLQALFGSRLALFERLGRELSPIGRTRVAGRSVVLVNAPALVQEVLIDRADDFMKGPGLRVLARPLLGDGLLTSEGDQHRQQRKLVAPAFAHQRVSRYASVMAEHADAEQRQWQHNDVIDVAQAMMRLTLGIVGKTLFDTNLRQEADVLGRDIATLQRSFARRSRLPVRIPHGPKVGRARARLNRTVYGMIHFRRESGEDRGDLLSMLLLSKDEDTGQNLTDTQVRDEAMTLFLAGHETTAQALSWSWYLLARNPEVFERLRVENGYGLLVMKEAMRLYPPAYILGRSAVRDTRIGAFQVKAGELLFISPWLLHRNPEYFADPERFDPERFRPEREATLPKYAYIPFGGGKRICIGNQFALMEGQICLETIEPLIHLELVSKKAARPEALMTLRPRGGVQTVVRRLH